MATLAQQHIQVEFKARHRATAMEVPNEAPEKAEPKVKESQQHPGPGHQSGDAHSDGCKLGQTKEEIEEEYRTIKLLLAGAKDEARI